jgi:iron complex transport system substrate-binding protein
MPWIVLIAIVAAIPLVASIPFGRRATSPATITRVDGGSDWPRTLVERFPNGEEGRRLVLPHPPQRIVSVTLATDEILLDLIDPQRIVALSELAPQPGSLVAERVDGIEHFVGADVESIIALDPDICFLASYNRKEMRSLLLDSGIPVYVFHCFHTLEHIRENLRAVGQAVGGEEAAESLIAEMDRKINSVGRRIPPREQWPTALVYDKRRWVAGSQTTQTEIFAHAGLRNAAAERGIEGYANLSEETVLEMDPDYLVVVAPSDGTNHHRDWLLKNPALAPLKAIREERFLVLEEPLLSTVSHHIATAIVRLAHQAYPDQFSEPASKVPATCDDKEGS